MVTVSLSASPTTLIETEGTSLTFTLSLDQAPPAGGLTVTVAPDPTSEVQGTEALGVFDFNALIPTGGIPSPGSSLGSFDFTFTAPTATLTLPIFDDPDDTDGALDGLRTAVFSLQESADYDIDPNAGSVELTYADTADQVPISTPTVSLSASPTTLIETEGTSLTFTLSLDQAPPAGGLTVTVAPDPTSEVQGTEALGVFDFNALIPTGGIPSPGSSLGSFDFTFTAQTATLTLPIFDDPDDSDGILDGLRTAVFSLQESSNYQINPDAGSVQLTYADTADQVSGDSGFEGTSGSDRIRGSSTDDEISGLGGRDTLIGGGGNDEISGGGGRDNIRGSGGNDALSGDGGRDTLRGGGGNDTLFGGGGSDLIIGNGGRDIYVLENRGGTDTFRGFRSQDRLGLSNGLTFDDLVFVTRGNNTLIRAGNRSLAIVLGAQPDDFTESDFVDV
ncbi:MAG: calcium-binding protein [Cyanothece sp. SIO2G6]|nr:calcium-binding protein [Cyanothece sp. SIO2G6]